MEHNQKNNGKVLRKNTKYVWTGFRMWIHKFIKLGWIVQSPIKLTQD